MRAVRGFFRKALLEYLLPVVEQNQCRRLFDTVQRAVLQNQIHIRRKNFDRVKRSLSISYGFKSISLLGPSRKKRQRSQQGGKEASFVRHEKPSFGVAYTYKTTQKEENFMNFSILEIFRIPMSIRTILHDKRTRIYETDMFFPDKKVCLNCFKHAQNIFSSAHKVSGYGG